MALKHDELTVHKLSLEGETVGVHSIQFGPHALGIVLESETNMRFHASYRPRPGVTAFKVFDYTDHSREDQFKEAVEFAANN